MKATHPVSQACLACRSSKAKCDGVKPICAKCQRLGKECVYVKSMRGGLRIPRQAVKMMHLMKSLDNLLQLPALSPLPAGSSQDLVESVTVEQHTIEDVVNAFYQQLYPSFPILPRKQDASLYIARLSAESPVKAAMQMLLVLIPNTSTAALQRKEMSTRLAARTYAQLEHILEARRPTLDLVQTLYLLSIWEWAQNGRPAKSRSLSVQALQLSVEIGLHQMDRQATHVQLDWDQETARRTWWSCFTHHTALSVIASTSPIMALGDPRLCVAYPTLMTDSWRDHVETIHRCAVVTEHTNRLSSPGILSAGETESTIRQLQQLDQDMQNAKHPVLSLVDTSESQLINSLDFATQLGLATSTVHLHRHQAFAETAVYRRDVCGLNGNRAFSLFANESAPSVLDDAPPPPNISNATPIDSSDYAIDLSLDFDMGVTKDASLVEKSRRLFPSAMSLQRCNDAATSVVQAYTRQYETRTQPTILSPICACGLATAVYASVLLTLTLFTDPSTTSDQLQEKIQGVEILLQPLQDTGQMWETVQVMAEEGRAALDALVELVSLRTFDQ